MIQLDIKNIKQQKKVERENKIYQVEQKRQKIKGANQIRKETFAGNQAKNAKNNRENKLSVNIDQEPESSLNEELDESLFQM